MKILTFTYNEDLNNIIDEKYKNDNPDLIIAIGGDGTFISAIKKYLDLEVPFYGIANGTLNFLMNNHKYENINDLLEKIGTLDFFKKLDVIKTPILNFYINNVKQGIAVNEVVYGDSIRKYPKTNITFKKFDGSIINKDIHTSMIVVSSPIGSTGLAKNINPRINPLELPLLNIDTIASNININETINNDDVIITNLSNIDMEIIYDNNIFDVLLKPNDILKISLGKYIRICYDDYKSLLLKRHLYHN